LDVTIKLPDGWLGVVLMLVRIGQHIF
jgi:hypothetical protein